MLTHEVNIIMQCSQFCLPGNPVDTSSLLTIWWTTMDTSNLLIIWWTRLPCTLISSAVVFYDVMSLHIFTATKFSLAIYHKRFLFKRQLIPIFIYVAGAQGKWMVRGKVKSAVLWYLVSIYSLLSRGKHRKTRCD